MMSDGLLSKVFGASIIILLTSVGCFLTSCSEEASSSRMIDGPFSLKYNVKHFTGAPMSAEEDKVYILREDGSEELLFHGFGGAAVDIKSPSDDVLVISYCGGSIEETLSSLIDPRSDDKVIKIIRVQPVIVDNVNVGGEDFCSPTRKSPQAAVVSNGSRAET